MSTHYSSRILTEAAKLAERIEVLEAQLAGLLQGSEGGPRYRVRKMGIQKLLGVFVKGVSPWLVLFRQVDAGARRSLTWFLCFLLNQWLLLCTVPEGGLAWR
jgi:hypothetical protein